MLISVPTARTFVSEKLATASANAALWNFREHLRLLLVKRSLRIAVTGHHQNTANSQSLNKNDSFPVAVSIECFSPIGSPIVTASELNFFL